MASGVVNRTTPLSLIVSASCWSPWKTMKRLFGLLGTSQPSGRSSVRRSQVHDLKHRLGSRGMDHGDGELVGCSSRARQPSQTIIRVRSSLRDTAIEVVENAKERLRHLGGKCQIESLTSDDVSKTTKKLVPDCDKDSLVSARDGRPFFVLCLTESNRQSRESNHCNAFGPFGTFTVPPSSPSLPR